ncbi:HDHD3 family protein [Megaselia abdita]
MSSGKLIKNLRHIRLVTFDITGTLLNFRRSPSEQYVDVAESFGYTIPAALLSASFIREYKIMEKRHPNYGKTTYGMTYMDWWRVLVANTFLKCNGNIPKDELLTIANELIKQFKTETSWVLVDGTVELITKIKEAGISVGVISNFDGSLEEILKNMKLPEFDFVLSSYNCGATKPHPQIFQTALKLGGNVKPHQSLHIGDTFELDYLGAKNAGWSAVLVNPSNDLSEISDHRMYNDNHVFQTLNLFLNSLLNDNIKF